MKIDKLKDTPKSLDKFLNDPKINLTFTGSMDCDSDTED